MASKKKTQKNRNSGQHRPRTATQARARERQRRNKQLVTGGVAIVIVIAIVGLIVGIGASSKSASSTTTSSTTSTTTPTATTAPAVASVAGKPCVKVSSPLPKGAPAVPVVVGPPPTNLVIKDLKVGTGAVVTKTNTVSVDYIGVACSTGKIFDSSYSRNEPFSVTMSGGVIQGWLQGLIGMKVGGERLLGIPPALGYGTAGQGAIAPGETLWFVVHARSEK